ncbi:MAG: glycosyltransferase [bacterium]|nr:glycosyltransferase [bacterium]
MRSLADKAFKGRVLFVGQSYYHNWYLSRELRKLGWKADVLNWDPGEKSQIYYHGEDFKFVYHGKKVSIKSMIALFRHLVFYFRSLMNYDLYHFSNAHEMQFGSDVHYLFKKLFAEYAEIGLLKKFGRKIVYANNGCLDGVAQTSFSKWGPECVCAICRWQNVPAVCSDARNLAWGKIRNRLADYQLTIGGNRVDYNNDPLVHEVPQYYCLDQDLWAPELPVPEKYRLSYPQEVIKIYHAVGNFASRSAALSKNIKCTHIYLPVIERLKAEGHKVELVFFHDVPNKIVRYYQAQADIVVDMLTYGWFGANVREGMMLGKPCVCFLRPEWIESIRREVPDYVKELPVVNATPGTVYEVLKDLIEHPEKRREIGRRSREFAVKWHSAVAGARKLDQIYSELLHLKTN